MWNIKFDSMEIGRQYSVDELAEIWKCGGRFPRMALAKGILTPEKSNVVVFLVTHGNDIYEDIIKDDYAYLNGEKAHKKDNRIIKNLSDPKDEFHLFYRQSKHDNHGKTMPFTYYGEYSLIDAVRNTEKASVFKFRKVASTPESVCWVFPCNLERFDIDGAYEKHKYIEREQGHYKINKGDTIYYYVGEPEKRIKYKLQVVETDLPGQTIDVSEFVKQPDAAYTGKYMKLVFQHRFITSELSMEYLQQNGVAQIQGPSRIPESIKRLILQAEIDDYELEEDQRIQEVMNDSSAIIPAGAVHTGVMEPAPAAKERNGAPYYPHDPQKSRNAISHAGFKCEIDASHPTFIRKSSGQNYMEAHHLVPMSKQGSFVANIDKEENIVSLCSNCHNQIHYGCGAKKLVEKLYADRKAELERIGIFISLEQLLKYYNC